MPDSAPISEVQSINNSAQIPEAKNDENLTLILEAQLTENLAPISESFNSAEISEDATPAKETCAHLEKVQWGGSNIEHFWILDG